MRESVCLSVCPSADLVGGKAAKAEARGGARRHRLQIGTRGGDRVARGASHGEKGASRLEDFDTGGSALHIKGEGRGVESRRNVSRIPGNS